MPLDQLLKDEEFPETERLLRSTGLKHLNQVADRKGMNPYVSPQGTTAINCFYKCYIEW
jgi:hypothetical protein